MEENVILVDVLDNQLGLMPKMEAHEKAVLHRAFSVFIFNDEGELMLQQRAAHKYHSPLLWTNTCCSHQRDGESNIEAGKRRFRAVPYADVLTTIIDSPKPVIAAVNGAAFAGGLGLVGASDIVVTREDVQFSFSEVRIGVIPAIISVVCLPKLGTHHGMKLFLTGERFDGPQAVAMGLAHRAVSGDDLHAAVQEEIDMINMGGPIAVQECKKLVRRVPQLSLADGFKETAEWSARMFRSEEGAEGMASFREKRKPSWVQN